MGNRRDNWSFQWDAFKKDEAFFDDDLFLFKQWIYPNTLEDFTGKTVLDCGYGRGQHLRMVAPYAKKAVGIDLNTADVAREYLKDERIELLQGDLAQVTLPEKFDIVYCIGVLQHTDDPAKSFMNLKRQLKKGGRLMIWVYSREGNALNYYILEPLNELVFKRLGRRLLLAISLITTVLLYLPIYTVYLLPLRFLPFYEYFANFRKLTFEKNYQNVFDKLNAPQTHFITKAAVESWFDPAEFENIHISPYLGVSWRASGTLK
ncbi:MAG: class I SAM-dependent methyltransferase [Elusimicrobiota bacterium]|nr:class I SAM-dependent methyltransferase [Elusimicrobiota bacterium]